MSRLSRRLALSLLLLVAFTIGLGVGTPAVADAIKAVTVANTVQVTSADVTRETVKVNLDQTRQIFSSGNIDVSHAKQLRLNAFMECLTACPSGTKILLTIDEGSNNNSYIVDQIQNPASEFTSKTYDTPGVTWTLHIASSPNCQCAVAIVSLFARSN
jgi:hypothetical protein